MGKNAYSLVTAFVPQSSLTLKVPTRTVNVQTFPSPSVTGPFHPFSTATARQSPSPPMWKVRQVAFWRPRGASRATQSCAQGRPGEALLVTAALASKALRVACASAGPATAVTPASQKAFAPRRAPPPTPGRSLNRGAWGSRRRRCATGWSPACPEMSLHPTIPGHSPWGRVAEAPAAVAAAGSAWRELCPCSGPGQPALGGGAGRRRTGGGGGRDDSAAGAEIQ